MFCIYCGEELTDKGKFCLKCGRPIENGLQIKAEEKKVKTHSKKSYTKRNVAIAAGFFAMKAKAVKGDYTEYLSDGEKYLEEIDYENAEASYLAAIAVDPKQKEPYLR